MLMGCGNFVMKILDVTGFEPACTFCIHSEFLVGLLRMLLLNVDIFEVFVLNIRYIVIFGKKVVLIIYCFL